MVMDVLACAAMVFASVSQSATATTSEVVAREQQRVGYLVARDYDHLAEMLSPTMTYTHSSGVLDSKDKILADLRSGQIVYRALNHRDVQVRLVTPDVAILNGISDVESIVGGQPQSVPLRFTIVYVRKSGIWLMEAWQATRRAVG